MYDSNKTHRSLHEAALGIIRPAAPLEDGKESTELKEAYVTKHPATKKAWDFLLNKSELDAEELEDLLFTMAHYYIDAGEDSEDDNGFTLLGKNLLKAAQGWQKRSGN